MNRRYPEPVIHAVGVGGALLGGAYLTWRLGWTMNWGAWWLSVPLFVTELHGYLTFLLYFIMTWRIDPLERPNAPPGWSVDFFIPTYNEPYDVLSLTVAGAAAIDYPHETYVLDDGKRPWVRLLCRKFGVNYVTREDNAGAKAGNINHALTVSNGDVICIVDADFVPSRRYIDEMLGYFTDPEVALVQAPQEFYNTDSFQHAGPEGSDWNEQSSFYRVIQPGKNHSNSVFWCGSPSMIRRAALESVGGVATETITEDLHTTFKLHRKGWRTVFHNAVVARGVAPEDYDSYILQRLRWAQGSMQIIRREWRGRGLTWVQKLNYLASTGTYFDSYRKLIMLLLIPAILISDAFPVAADARLFFAAWAAQFAVLGVSNVVLGRGHYRYLQTEMFDFLKMFAFIEASVVLVVEGTLKFKVTPKGQAGERHIHPLLYPFIALLGVYVLVIGLGAARLAGFLVHSSNPAATIAAIVWGVAVVGTLLAVTRYGYEHVTRRRTFRNDVDLAAVVYAEKGPIEARVTDLTLSGARIEVAGPIDPEAPLRFRFVEDGLYLRGEARHVAERPDGGATVGVSFDLDDDSKVALARLVASSIFDSRKGGTPSGDGDKDGDSLRSAA